MKVKAVREGYYANQIKQIGETFEIKSKEELGLWMEVIEEKEAPVSEEVVEVPADAQLDVEAPATDAISDLI